MIAIINITPDAPLTGPNTYRVQINREVICEFEHNRTYDGLAQCLRDAADAVEQSGDSRLVKILLTANGVKG